jgi:hypothetical protein
MYETHVEELKLIEHVAAQTDSDLAAQTYNLGQAVKLLRQGEYLSQPSVVKSLREAAKTLAGRIAAQVDAATGDIKPPAAVKPKIAAPVEETPELPCMAPEPDPNAVPTITASKDWRCLKCNAQYSADRAEEMNFVCCQGAGMKVFVAVEQSQDYLTPKQDVPPAAPKPIESTPEKPKSRSRKKKPPAEKPADATVKAVLVQGLTGEHPMKPPAVEGAENITDIYSDFFGCDKCSSDNLIVSVDPAFVNAEGHTPATYRCVACKNPGVIEALTSEEAEVVVKDGKVVNYEELIEAAPKVEEPKPKKKSRKKKAKDEPVPEAVENHLNVSAEKANEEADKILADVLNFESAGINGDVVRAEFGALVDGYTKDRLIKEWERLTGRGYDPAVTDDELRKAVIDSMAGSVGVV